MKNLQSKGGTPYILQTVGIIQGYVLGERLPSYARLELKEGVAGTVKIELAEGGEHTLSADEINRLIPLVVRILDDAETTIDVNDMLLCV